MTKTIEAPFMAVPKTILVSLGLWLTPNRVLPLIYLGIVMLTQYSFLLFELIYVFQVWGDINEVTEASFMLFTQASLCYKCTMFLKNKEKLVELIALMRCEAFSPQSTEQKSLLKRQATRITRLCFIYLNCAVWTSLFWVLIPAFENARTFPFKIWMPVYPERSPQWELGYGYQVISIFVSALLFVGVDSAALSAIMFGCGQLDIIMNKLEGLQNVPLSVRVLTAEERTKRLRENNELFLECVKQYREVARFIQLVEDSYHANILFQLSGTVFIMCIIGLRINIVEKNSAQYYSMFSYSSTILSQLLLYCACGNFVTTQSEDLRNCIYLCPWYEQDVSFKRSLWITMERMKRPIIFKAGHYIPLSRPIFISILRSSYSYFAVLNQARNK